MSYVFVAAAALCTSSSILSIWNATYTLLKINSLPTECTRAFLRKLDKAKTKMGGVGNLLVTSVIYANISLASLLTFVCSAVYLFFGPVHFFIVLPIFLVTIITAFLHEAWSRGWYSESLAEIEQITTPAITP